MNGGEPPGRRFYFLSSRATEELEHILPKELTNDKFISVIKHRTLNTGMGLGSYAPVIKFSTLLWFMWPYSRSGRHFV